MLTADPGPVTAEPPRHPHRPPRQSTTLYKDTAKMCARFIAHLFSYPDILPATSSSAVTPSLAHFVAYALHRTQLHSSVTFCTLYLLSRLKNRFPAARGLVSHLLYIFAFTIASKVICDSTYSNRSWCVIGQGIFTLQEINQMEREMCGYLEWVLNFKPEDLRDFKAMVRKEYGSASAAPAPVAFPIPRQLVEPRKQSSADYANGNLYLSPVFTPLALILQLHLTRVLDVPNTAVCRPGQGIDKGHRPLSKVCCLRTPHLPQAVQDFLSENSPSSPPSQSSMDVNTLVTSPGEQPDMIKSISSFKVLTECPISTVYLFQVHRSAIPLAIDELIVTTRHILSREFRPAFIPSIDCLTSEHILIGTGINGQETLRLLAYSMLGDLIHHIREELSPEQLRRIIYLCSCCLHDPAFSSGVHNMSAKLLANLVDVNLKKFPKPETAASLLALLEPCVDKLGAVQQEKPEDRTALSTKDVQIKDVHAMDADDAEPSTKRLTLFDIEKAEPVQVALFVLENKAEALKEFKILFRTLLHVYKTVLSRIRTSEGPVPDGELIRRLFQNCVRCLTIYDDGCDGGKEAFEMLLQVFHEIKPHIFQEVWTTEMQFFIDHIQEHQNLLAMPQLLLSSEMVSHQLVAILLRYLVGKLDTLGEQSQKTASITLRLFKMCFTSVTVFPELNEPILFHHLSKLIMDSLRLATKAADPTNYLLLLRGLFRAMGGGKFKSLYNEVLPLLRNMLESLNRQLQAAEPSKQDLLVELYLTVPVRLTNLLPFLGFLMRPLVHSLRAGPELIAQGLRTLELCIDNLTQEFLDLTLSPVLRELMAALHSHLKPQPGNHQHAHTTVRILGKLGGRNRRLQHQEPQLEYQGYSSDVTIALMFNRHNQTINIRPTCLLATRLIQELNAFYRQDAFVFVQRTLELFMREGIDGSEGENIFSSLVDSLFVALQDSDLQDKAATYIREVSEIIFLTELSQGVDNRVSKITSIYMDRVPRLLAATGKEQVARAQAVFGNILSDLLALEAKATAAIFKIT
ncbi:Cyclin, N-terminal domain [Ceratobasidium sp. AG-Ba]|nr:Cyclin, N-terminal domain [Ceratobasidium sp. AG-Ba]